jgi:hypothetical protein
VTVLGVKGAVDAIPVTLAGADSRQIAVTYETVHLRQIDARLVTSVVEETQLDARRVLREHGEVGALTVPGGAQRIGDSRPSLHDAAD